MPEIRIVHLDPPQPCGVFHHGRETCGQPAEYATCEAAPGDLPFVGPGYLLLLPICRAHVGALSHTYSVPPLGEQIQITMPANLAIAAHLNLSGIADASDLILVTATVKLPTGASPAIYEHAAALLDNAIAQMMRDAERLRARARRMVEGN